MNRYTSTKAVVINKKSIRDSDLLVILITPDHGKIVTMAKGVRSIKSRRLGSLQLGNIIKVSLFSKNEYLWISESSTLTHFSQNPKNLIQSNLLFYFLEILNNLIAENQRIDTIFPIIEKVINAINKNHFSQYIQGEIDFIKVLGFGLPPEINDTFDKQDYKTCQSYIKGFFESIIEKPLESSALFR